MRRCGWLAAWGIVVGAGIAHAGVYSTVEPSRRPTPEGRVFHDQLVALRQLTNPEVLSPERNQALLLASLASRSKTNLTPLEKLNWGAALIRLGNYEEAAKVLEPASRQDPRNYLILSTLATAQFLDGQQRGFPDLVRRAQDNLSGALELWPKEWKDIPKETQEMLQGMGWHDRSPTELAQSEKYQLKLMRQRGRQLAMPKEKVATTFQEWDGLFDDGSKPPQPIRFVAQSGSFEPGKGRLAPKEAAKLPKDALVIVQQLLLWMPNDNRLEWLLAELFNVQGDTDRAVKLFRDIAKRENYKEVANASKGLEQDAKLVAGGKDAKKLFQEKVEPPVLFREHWAALEDYVAEQKNQTDKKLLEDMQQPTVPPVTPGDQKIGSAAPMDVWTLLVGFVVGAGVALFAYWQLLEGRRRWVARSTSRSGGPRG